MYKDDFKARYTTIPFAIYREHCELRNHTVIAHRHKEIELISLTAGRADFYVDTVHYEATAGDVVVIPPYAIHRIQISEKETVEYDCVCFNVDLLWDGEIKSGLLGGTVTVSCLIDGKLPYTEKMQELIAASCDECETKRSGWELSVIGCMSLIFGSLKQNGHFKSTLKEKRNSDFSQKAMTYINESYHLQITSNTAACALFISNSYFCRSFKRAFGCSFSEYLLIYRLEKAKILLYTTSDPIMEISFRVGFNSCSYFSEKFKERFGISPRTFRQKRNSQFKDGDYR